MKFNIFTFWTLTCSKFQAKKKSLKAFVVLIVTVTILLVFVVVVAIL